MKARSASPDNIYRKLAEINLVEMNKDGGTGYRFRKAKAMVDSLVNEAPPAHDRMKFQY